MDNNMQGCTICKEVKTLSEYYKQSLRPKGYRSECIVCFNKKRKPKKESKLKNNDDSIDSMLAVGIEIEASEMYDYLPTYKRETDKDIIMIALSQPYPYDYLNEKLEEEPERLDKLHDILSYCREKNIFATYLDNGTVSFSTVMELALQ